MSRYFAILVVVVASWFWAPCAFAARATLEMDVSSLQVGQSAELRLVLVDGQARGTPEVPAPAELLVRYMGASQAVSSVNFKTTRSVTYSYTVTGVQEGEATLGPVTIPLASGPVVAAPLRLTVRPRSVSRGGGTAAEAYFGAEGSPIRDQVYQVWVGQTVVYHFLFRHKEALLDARWTPPSFDGFVPEPTVPQDQREYQVQEADGTYTVHAIDVPLIATTVGTRQVKPAVVSASFPAAQRSRQRSPVDDFFPPGFGRMTETRTETITGDPVKVNIRPLPVEGRPAGFGGLVGHFVVTSEIARERVKAGDSVTQTITVRGDGSLASFRLPPPPEVDGLRFYDDDPEATASLVAGHLEATVTCRRAVVATRDGAFETPVIPVAWFDPTAGRYVEESLPAHRIEVEPGEGGDVDVAVFGQPAATPQVEVSSLADDILPLHQVDSAERRRISPNHPVPLALAGIPMLAFAGLKLVALGRRGTRRGRAAAAIRRGLRNLPAGREARLAALERGFRDASALALGGDPAGVDPSRLRANLPGDVAEVAVRAYDALTAARYGGQAADDALVVLVEDAVGRMLGRRR